ncbi:peptide deformylase [Candidatus Margulisiibacteriota bacterium]
MSVLPILTIPNPVLKQLTEKVLEFNNDLKELVQDMFDTVADAGGVGLAGPQAGILERIIIVSFEGRKLVFINPEITWAGDEMVLAEEGCLSCPGRTIVIKRPDEIKVTAQDIKGEPFTIKLKDWISRIVQHEIDHLNGVLILDREDKGDDLLKGFVFEKDELSDHVF